MTLPCIKTGLEMFYEHTHGNEYTSDPPTAGPCTSLASSHHFYTSSEGIALLDYVPRAKSEQRLFKCWPCSS